MTYVILPVAALVPALILLCYFHKRDAYPEPPRVLWGTFLWGAFSCLPAVMLAWPLDALIKASPYAGTLVGGFLTAFLAAAIPEELAKMGVLRFFSMRNSAFDEPMDGLVYGAASALGFAALENVLYVSDGGVGLAVLRGLTAVPGHALYGAVMGFYLGRWRFAKTGRGLLLLKAFLVPMAMHGLYDWPLMAMPQGLVLIWLVPGVLLWGLLATRRHLRLLRALQSAPAVENTGMEDQGVRGKGRAPMPLRGYVLVALGSVLLLWLSICVALGGWALVEIYRDHKPQWDTVWGLGLFSLPGWAGWWPFRAGIRHLNSREKGEA